MLEYWLCHYVNFLSFILHNYKIGIVSVYLIGTLEGLDALFCPVHYFRYHYLVIGMV